MRRKPVKKFKPKPRPGARTPPIFSITQFSKENNGEKIGVYAPTGMGKSTLASMLPDCVFIQPDEGLSDLVNPLTGEQPDIISGIETFEHLRLALQDVPLFENKKNIIIDTITFVQSMAESHVIANVKHEHGKKIESIEDYGFGKGYKHVYDAMNLLKGDLDVLVRQNKNVVLLAQLVNITKIDTTFGSYLYAQPELYDKQSAPVVGLFNAWANFVFKLDYEQVKIEGKIGVTSGTRALFTQPEFSYQAKSRGRLLKGYPVVAFAEESDDSIWRLLFPEYYSDE
ncbi:hypothetical protein LCGC14_0343090 [marine sediment metagenome]|uniref:Uncharacterized protein n=1 Tax=marine sediment metagenome TaxID=412755 RepID=A0A0F9W0E0_9ZZZZ